MRFNRSKYGAKKTEVVVNGVVVKFDSKAEAERYDYLFMLEKAGEISDLVLQPKFMLQDKFKAGNKTIRAMNYIADFMYLVGDQVYVEDTKGFKTPDYKLKMKLFLHTYKNVIFTEVTKKGKGFEETVYDVRA